MVTLLTNLICIAIGLQATDSMLITIKEDTLFTEIGDQKISFSVRLENATEQDYLAYNLNLFDEGSDADSYYCDGNGSAGNSVFVYDIDGNQKYVVASFSKGIYDDPVKSDDVQAIHDKSKKLLLESRKVVRSRSLLETTVTFDMNRFNLQPGVYDVYIIYSSGHFLYDLLGAKTIRKHQEELKAQLFQGCIKSNTVKLVVK